MRATVVIKHKHYPIIIDVSYVQNFDELVYAAYTDGEVYCLDGQDRTIKGNGKTLFHALQNVALNIGINTAQ